MAISASYRRDNSSTDSASLTYGEVDIKSFVKILELVAPQPGEVFVDLGSGRGKAVLTAALVYPLLSRCHGIELVDGLAAAADSFLALAQGALEAPPPPPAAAATDARKAAVPRRGGGKKTAAAEGVTAQALEDAICDILVQETQGRVGGGSDGGGSGGGGGGGGSGGGGGDGSSDGGGGGNSDDGSNGGSSGESGAGGGGGDSGGSVSTEALAACLVVRLGHRAYKASLRGHGTLARFLLQRCAAADARLRLMADGHVALRTHAAAAAAADAAPASDGNACGGSGDRAAACLDVAHSSGDGDSTLTSSSSSSGSGGDGDGGDGGGGGGGGGECTSGGAGAGGRCASGGDSGGDSGNANNNSAVGASASGGDESAAPLQQRQQQRAARAPPPPAACLRGALSGARVALDCGDIFALSSAAWRDADIVYCASLLFSAPMVEALAAAAARLRVGARVVSLRALAAPALRLVHNGFFRMSWQMARVYIYKRVAPC